MPFRHGAEVPNSTRDTAILSAIERRDWEQLCVLLGVQDAEFGVLLAAWPRLSPAVRQAIVTVDSR